MPYRLPVLTSWAGPPYLIVSLATPDGARQSGRSLNPPRELPDRNRDRHCGSGRSTSARNRCFDRFVLSCRWEDASRREPCARLGAVETSSKKRTIPFPLSYDGTITLAHDLFNRRAHHFGSSLPALRQAFLRKGASKFVADGESVHFRVSWWVTAGPLSMIDRGEPLIPDDTGRVRFALSFWKSIIPIAIAVVVVFGIINAPFGMWGE